MGRKVLWILIVMVILSVLFSQLMIAKEKVVLKIVSRTWAKQLLEWAGS